jgi:chromosomal replication initiator protein
VVKDDSDRLSALRDALRRRLGAERFELWLGNRTRLELSGNALRVVCASRAELQFLRRKLHHPLAECCHGLWSPAPTVAFEEEAGDHAPLVSHRRAYAPAVAAIGEPRPSLRTQNVVPPLPRVADRTFESFTLGASNRLAAQAARDLAQHPGRFTPLLLHGPSGCGKSHLLEAVDHAARAARGRLRAVALTAEQFTTQFLDALHRRALPGFRHKARSVDLLLVDDVQFFDNKHATIEELIYTIDALHGRNGQVVLTSDRSAADLHAISPELASRLSGGLSVAIEPPDYTVRVGVVRSISERLGVQLSEAVVQLVARQVVGSARLISGAINRLMAASMAAASCWDAANAPAPSTTEGIPPISLELAEGAIADFCRQHAPQVRLPDIQRAVCDLFGVEPASLRSSRKTKSVAEPRMLAMWLARRYTRAALSEIGDFFGGRSHSTVVSAKRKFDGLISRGGEITVGELPCLVDEAVRKIEARLRTG